MSDEQVPHGEPFARFEKLLAAAEATGMANPNAMVVSSADDACRPSARVVLLKGADERGFVFYTNLESRKGVEIRARPEVCLNFFWRRLDRQVVVAGAAEAVSDEEADAYFASRPRTSQLGAWASRQSRPLASRAVLEAEVARYEAKYLGREVPRPPHWSGFRVVPARFEFWAAGAFRLHDRFAYERSAGGWRRWRLNP